MCKIKFRKGRPPVSVCLSTLVALSMALSPTLKAQLCTPLACNDSGLTTAIQLRPIVAHVGDTIQVFQIGVGLIPTACVVTNGQSFLMYPDGLTAIVAGGSGATSIQMYQNGYNLLGTPSGPPDSCSRGPDAAQCLPVPSGITHGCLPISTSYVVNANDINQPMPRSGIQWSSPRGASIINFAAKPGKIQFATATDAVRVHDGSLQGGQAPTEVTIVNPGLTVRKECIDECPVPPGGTAVYGQPIKFRVTVCNTGDVNLAEVIVTDFPPGGASVQLTNIALIPTNPGLNCVTFTNSYTPSGNLCGPFTNTVVACGHDFQPLYILGFQPKTVCATNTAVCTVCTSPGIDVTKECLDPVVTAGGPTRYRVRVQNAGNVPLQNVRLADDSFTPGVPGDDVTINVPGTLAPGAFFPPTGWITNAVTTTTAQCGGTGTITNTVVATGENVCSAAQTVTDTARCSIRVECPPILAIERTGTNVALHWPADATGYALQSATNLSPVAWLAVTTAPVLVGKQFFVTNPISGDSRFYRLRK